MSLAEQIAEVSARISDAELRIFQHQKRIENLLAKGADVTEPRSAIAVLRETLAYLETYKSQLEKQQHRDAGG